jgi:hypothetical protein
MGVFNIFRDPRRERLHEAIDAATCCVERRRDDRDVGWLRQADIALKLARDALDRGEIDRGWAMVQRVELLEIESFCSAELTAAAAALDAEVDSGRIKGWRRKAIKAQLKEVLRTEPGSRSCALAPCARRVMLRHAMHLRAQSYANTYRDLAIIRRFQTILAFVAALLLAACLIGAAFSNGRFNGSADQGWVVLGAALAGALGGITSALQRVTRRIPDRVPQRLGSLGSSLSRPLIGAIAGLTVFLAVRAGVTQTSEQRQMAYLFLLAFGAGFFERLVVRDPRDDEGDMAPNIATDTTELPLGGDDPGREPRPDPAADNGSSRATRNGHERRLRQWLLPAPGRS